MQRDQGPPNALADERWETHGSEASHDDRVGRQDVPKEWSRVVLIQARIAAGLSQQELVERLGSKEQQIQRYEATDDASASLTRVCEVARTLGWNVKAEAYVA